MTWLLDNLDLVGALALEHIRQSAIAIVLSFLIAVPLGAVAWRFRLVRGPLLTITGLLYTLPSLALLMLLPALTGVSVLSEVNLITALIVYGVALLVRSVADGLDAVNPDSRLAAVAMGYGPVRRFLRVDLPLAGPVILAGLRVTSVSTIALATVGILVGTTNLGYLFTNGYGRRIIEEILAGIVAVAVIAVFVDVLLVMLGRLLLPWARPQSGARTTLATGAVA